MLQPARGIRASVTTCCTHSARQRVECAIQLHVTKKNVLRATRRE
jgi:hypothetical protein